MKSHGIRLLIIFGIITLSGILFFQVYWVKKAYDTGDHQFNQTMSVALFDVASKIADFNKSVLQVKAPVNQVSSNYFIVEVNDVLDKDILELLLRREFDRRNLKLDYEYAIYDCHANEMVYGRYVNTGDPADTIATGHVFAKCPTCTYYFGIHFPGKRNYLISNMNEWFISSFIMLSAVAFFGWSLWLVFRQKRLSEIQRDFVNNMTHEFRTPISTIAISAEVIQKEPSGTDVTRIHNYARIIAEQNQRLREQVDKVLQAAGTERKKPVLEKEPVDLVELLKTVAETFETRIREQNGALKVELGTGIPQVMADPVHLTNILVNLIDNAMKYSRGAPHITLTLRKEGKTVYLAVADQGIGIEKRYQKRIFDRFFRVPAGDIYNVKGFGLGLHYVYHVVRVHGWKILLKSQPGSGSEFTIKIPSGSLISPASQTL
ncbi:MAG TPA: HAMP domain-containing sensor histidine kinase [Bacteroidales bacterium]|nr:HAMP domain-containing sensor histidine kinase [Bacteroidales bacterium]HRZ48905.1 HAMP domain-containing sensor histidine kinase [Bacteroidales bacterium]